MFYAELVPPHLFQIPITNKVLHSMTQHTQIHSCHGTTTGVLISPYTDLLPDVFCLMVTISRLMLVLLYI